MQGLAGSWVGLRAGKERVVWLGSRHACTHPCIVICASSKPCALTLRPCPAGGRLWAEHQLGGGAACDAGGHAGLHVTRGAALP